MDNNLCLEGQSLCFLKFAVSQNLAIGLHQLVPGQVFTLNNVSCGSDVHIYTVVDAVVERKRKRKKKKKKREGEVTSATF